MFKFIIGLLITLLPIFLMVAFLFYIYCGGLDKENKKK